MLFYIFIVKHEIIVPTIYLVNVYFSLSAVCTQLSMLAMCTKYTVLGRYVR